jgi:thioredoxin 1
MMEGFYRICGKHRDTFTACDFVHVLGILSMDAFLYTRKCRQARRIMAGVGVLEVSDATFDQEVLQSEQPVLVDFWAVWCGPCKAIAPIVDGVASAYAGKLKVAKVNVDQNGATPSRFGIRGIPALLFFKGGKVADQIVGYVPQDVIEEKIQRLLA